MFPEFAVVGALMLPISGLVLACTFARARDHRSSERSMIIVGSVLIALLWLPIHRAARAEDVPILSILVLPIVAPLTAKMAFVMADNAGDSGWWLWRTASGAVLIIGYLPQLAFALWLMYGL